jgi:hypothetical protein
MRLLAAFLVPVWLSAVSLPVESVEQEVRMDPAIWRREASLGGEPGRALPFELLRAELQRRPVQPVAQTLEIPCAGAEDEGDEERAAHDRTVDSPEMFSRIEPRCRENNIADKSAHRADGGEQDNVREDPRPTPPRFDVRPEIVDCEVREQADRVRDFTRLTAKLRKTC